MKHLFIINPTAGKKNNTEEFTRSIHKVFAGRGLDYEVKISAYKGNCTELAREAAQSGREYRIYACGGDGTLNEIVNGVYGHDNAAVTHFPCGSGNDFIRMFKKPELFKDLEALLDPAETLVDLISVNDEMYSLNICSMGFDARIGTEMARYKKLPGISGHSAYNVSVVMNLLKGIGRKCQVQLGEEIIDKKQTLICICNGQFYGGGFNPVPEARPNDGVLDVLIIKSVGVATVARVIGKYKRGEYASLPQYVTYRQVQDLTIRFPKENVVNVDGEGMWAKEARFSLAPHKLRFFHPKEAVLTWKDAETGRKTAQEEKVPVTC